MMPHDETGFSLQRFSTLQELSEAHFWFAGRQALVRKVLDRHLDGPVARALDVGCGPGHWLATWRSYAHEVCGIDPFAHVAASRTLEPGIRLLHGHASALPVGDQSTDLLVALDVLEHIDDLAALRDMHRALKPGGVLLVTVPAFAWLWSYRDADAGHLRRYSRATLCAALAQSGFEVAHLQYYQGLLFPAVMASRFLGRRTSRLRDTEDRPAPWLNRVLRAVNLLEVQSGLRLPFGSSLLTLARKPV